MSISSVFYHGTFHLLHPDLRTKTREWLVRRSNYFTCWYYPETERVSWYGGAIREDGSGQGLYMTPVQAKAWPHWVKSDIKIGPS